MKFRCDFAFATLPEVLVVGALDDEKGALDDEKGVVLLRPDDEVRLGDRIG